jgi:hypothetical protein
MSEQVNEQQLVSVERASNGLAVGDLASAIVGAGAGLIPIMFWLAIPLGILGFIFGIIGRRWAKADPSLGRMTMATWGIALGVIALALGIWGATIVAVVGRDLDRASNRLERQLT